MAQELDLEQAKKDLRTLLVELSVLLLLEEHLPPVEGVNEIIQRWDFKNTGIPREAAEKADRRRPAVFAEKWNNLETFLQRELGSL